jgi:hypothetical protein
VSDPRAKRLEQNEILFAESKDMIESRAENMRADFVCECLDPDCLAVIPLTLVEYTKLRSNEGRFAVTPGHEGDTDEVVQKNERFLVVARV